MLCSLIPFVLFTLNIFLSSKVKDIKIHSDGLIIKTSSFEYKSRFVVNCAGLYSDRVTSMTQTPKAKIIPFRGEYYKVLAEAQHLCKNLIYPVPDPNFPFLGVHFTRTIDEEIIEKNLKSEKPLVQLILYMVLRRAEFMNSLRMADDFSKK